MFARIALVRFLALAAIMTLQCSPLAAEQWHPVSVDDKGKGYYLDTDRVLRIGSTVTVFLRETALPDSMLARGARQRETALRIDCGKPEALVAYGDVVFEDGSRLRFYGESQINRYAKPTSLPFIATSMLASLQHDLCAVPSEVLVDVAHAGQNRRTQVDTASLRLAEDEVRAWVRYDYPVVALDMPYRNPYGSKRELMAVRCSKAEYAVLAGLDFDEDEVVSDGSTFAQPAYRSAAEGEPAELVHLLCDRSGALQRLPPARLVRTKARTWEIPLDPVAAQPPPAVTQALARAAGADKALALRLRKVRIETISRPQGGHKQQSVEERTVESRGAGLIFGNVKAPEYSLEDLSLYGLITVASRSAFPAGGGASRRLEGFNSTGTLVPAGAGEVFSYEAEYATVDSTRGRGRTRSRTQCKLGAAQPAVALNAKLTGTAVPVDCESQTDGQPSSKTHGWLLLDAGWFFQDLFETLTYRSESRLLEVETD